MGLSVEAKTDIKRYLSEVQKSISSGAALKDALRVAKEIIEMETGKSFEIDAIDRAYNSAGGVAEIFKSVDDITAVDVAGPGSSTTMKVQMTRRQAEQVENEAHEQSLILLELAKSPDVATAFKDKALTEMKRDMNGINIFIKDNPLLDRESTVMKSVREEKDRVASSIDELFEELQDLGAIVGGRSWKHNMARMVRKVPLVKRVVKDPSAWKRSIREKVLEIDKILEDGIIKLDQNNETLGSLKARAHEQMRNLQISMARTKLVSDFLQHYIKEKRSIGDEDTARIMEAEVVPRIERELNGAMTLYGVMLASVEAIGDLSRTNSMIITNSIQLRTVAAPAIAITESLKEAGKDAERIVKQGQKIGKFVESQLQEMVKQTKRAHESYAKAAGESVISPEVLEQVLTDLAGERENMIKRMVEAGVKLHTSNQKLVTVLNKASETLKNDSLAVQVDSLNRTGRLTKP
jgi:hypothetical protein